MKACFCSDRDASSNEQPINVDFCISFIVFSHHIRFNHFGIRNNQRSNQTLIPLFNRTTFPLHRNPQPFILDEMRLPFRNILSIICHHYALTTIVAPTRTSLGTCMFFSLCSGQGFEVPHSGFPAPYAGALMREARAVGIAKCAAVEGHAKDEL